MSSPRTALITGITGQDGTYLTERLLARGYRVHGLTRNPSGETAVQLRLLAGEHSDRLHLHRGDLRDPAAVADLARLADPDEVYNFGAQSHVWQSYDDPAETLEVNAIGVLRLLETLRDLQERSSGGKEIRFFQASSSELYGNQGDGHFNERVAFRPENPYGRAKLCAYQFTALFRDVFGLFACNGILFNHESPRRRESFVTRKITRAAARIREGLQETLSLGNLDVARDWGFADDYVDCIWRMLQHPTADDYVVATGRTQSLVEFLELAFAHVGLDWQDHVRVEQSLVRPRDVQRVSGDASRAKRRLGWSPTVSFADLVRMMVDADWELARQERQAA